MTDEWPSCPFHSPATPCCSVLCVSPAQENTQLTANEPCPQDRKLCPQYSEPCLQDDEQLCVDGGNPPKMFKFSTEEDIEELNKGVIPLNTSRSTKWAVKTFELWCQARNLEKSTENVPESLLRSPNISDLNKYLSMFVVEARKANGDEYPPATLHQILCGLLRFMREVTPDCPNFWNKADTRFKRLQNTLDAHFHRLHAKGIGRNVQHAEVFTVEEEDLLWESGVCGLDTPVALQNAAFYVVGKMFCLRGGIEHRELKLSQFHRFPNPTGICTFQNKKWILQEAPCKE